jgi:hypothetical protein
MSTTYGDKQQKSHVDTGRLDRKIIPDDGSKIFLRNVGIYLQVHTA